jgi:hypothetical protein
MSKAAMSGGSWETWDTLETLETYLPANLTHIHPSVHPSIHQPTLASQETN